MNIRRLPLIAGSALLTALLALALLLPAVARAQDPSPTPAPLGDFIIPTSTPLAEAPTATAVESVAPTPTKPGLFIPTSTPNASPTPTTPAAPAFPPLSAEDLNALNIQPGDVPDEFAMNQVVQAFTTADIVSALRDAGYTDLADVAQRLADTYGWTTSQGMTYTSCQPTLPVDEIRSEVAQLASPEAARAFLEDADAQNLFQELGYTGDSAPNVHGWQMTLPHEGVCFAQETEYTLMFDYWGLLITVAITADANTDPNLVWGLLDQLAPLLVARADALAPTPFPPTPTPGGGETVVTVTAEAPTAAPTELVITAVPTQEAATAAPTEPPAPTEAALLPTPTPFLIGPANTPAPLDASATLAELDALMPTLAEIGLPSPPFSENAELSGVFTFEEVVQLAQNIGVPALADAIEAAGTRDHMLGEVMRVWDTGDQCPATAALSLEVDLILFATAAGAQANLADEGTEQAWLDTGVFQSFEARPDGSVLGVGSLPHPCGQLSIYALSTNQGRVNIAVSAMATASATEDDILSALDVLTHYMAGKLDALDLG